jgi:hypothetical protein
MINKSALLFKFLCSYEFKHLLTNPSKFQLKDAYRYLGNASIVADIHCDRVGYFFNAYGQMQPIEMEKIGERVEPSLAFEGDE